MASATAIDEEDLPPRQCVPRRHQDHGFRRPRGHPGTFLALPAQGLLAHTTLHAKSSTPICFVQRDRSAPRPARCGGISRNADVVRISIAFYGR